MSNAYHITAVISTYNRCEMLTGALKSLLEQICEGVRYEIIVVDNNSADDTREVVERFIAGGHTNLRYVFEPMQGSSYARNAGVAAANAEIVAFADDDVSVAKDWIAKIKRAFDSHREIDCVGGKVLPMCSSPAPKWLTPDHWMPLALQDYGDNQLTVDLRNRLCLVSANLAFRREAILAAGLFRPELQRIKDGIGSMEDAELLERFWKTGHKCRYLPDLIVKTIVPEERLRKTYHRRWHRGHGYFYAIRRSSEIDDAQLRFMDVPAHLYKRAAIDAVRFLSSFIGNPQRAFVYETGLHFFYGFFRKRSRDYMKTAYRGPIRELMNFLRTLLIRSGRTSALVKGAALSERSGTRH